MSDYLDEVEIPFTYSELYAALRVISRRDEDARDSAAQYAVLAAERVRGRTEGAEADFTLLSLHLLAALSLRSSDAVARVTRLREARLPPAVGPDFRAEEDAFWAEIMTTVRSWADRLDGGTPAA